jgi:hypothetical protein
MDDAFSDTDDDANYDTKNDNGYALAQRDAILRRELRRHFIYDFGSYDTDYWLDPDTVREICETHGAELERLCLLPELARALLDACTRAEATEVRAHNLDVVGLCLDQFGGAYSDETLWAVAFDLDKQPRDAMRDLVLYFRDTRGFPVTSEVRQSAFEAGAYWALVAMPAPDTLETLLQDAWFMRWAERDEAIGCLARSMPSEALAALLLLHWTASSREDAPSWCAVLQGVLHRRGSRRQTSMRY